MLHYFGSSLSLGGKEEAKVSYQLHLNWLYLRRTYTANHDGRGDEGDKEGHGV